MSSRRAGEADIPVEIDGEKFTLTPSFEAMKTLSARSGGIMNAMQSVMRLDLDTIVDVLALGVGYGPTRRPPKDFAERVWRTGLTDDTGGMAAKAADYLQVLSRGGRRREEDSQSEGPPAGPTQSGP